MDEQFLQLKRFQKALQEFNDKVAPAWGDVEATYEEISSQWTGETRNKYDQYFIPLQEQMDTYLHRKSPSYSEFIQRQIQILERYFNGK